MSDEEVQSKLRKPARALMIENKIKNIISCIGNIGQIKDIGQRLELVTV